MALHTVVETSNFSRRAATLLSAEEHQALIGLLAAQPLAGEVIVGTGGVRKLRFGALGKGKSGGVRVIYYFCDVDIPLYALLVYGKNERADMTPAQRRAATGFAAAIKAARGAR